MALKPKRIQGDDVIIDKKCTNAAERGYMLIVGAAEDEVMLGGAVASGQYAAGLLLNDVEDLDLTTRPQNHHKDVVDIDDVVTVALEGQFLTDAIPDGVTPTFGAPAYLVASGLISDTPAGTGELNIPVGRWLGGPDADGFALLDVEIV